jgi:hypothetical protein
MVRHLLPGSPKNLNAAATRDARLRKICAMNLYKEKAIQIAEGDPGFCPKKKGGKRYQIEVLQEMCRKCRVRKKYRCERRW